jgi:D-alanyl-D-alanine-carboxypeptidase/D-alanyl-D-alanine-endopeptidase
MSVEVPLDAAVLAGYVGRYQLTPTIVLAITQAGGQLWAQATGQLQYQLFPEGGGKFFAKIADIEIRFEADSTGKAIAMSVVQHGITLRAARID